METKHKKAGTSDEEKISLIINLTIHNTTTIVQYSEEYHTFLSRGGIEKTIMDQ